jgi:hypothetical protein
MHPGVNALAGVVEEPGVSNSSSGNFSEAPAGYDDSVRMRCDATAVALSGRTGLLLRNTTGRIPRDRGPTGISARPP